MLIQLSEWESLRGRYGFDCYETHLRVKLLNILPTEVEREVRKWIKTTKPQATVDEILVYAKGDVHRWLDL